MSKHATPQTPVSLASSRNDSDPDRCGNYGPPGRCRAVLLLGYRQMRAGTRCPAWALDGGRFCWLHQSGINAGTRTESEVRLGLSSAKKG